MGDWTIDGQKTSYLRLRGVKYRFDGWLVVFVCVRGERESFDHIGSKIKRERWKENLINESLHSCDFVGSRK